MVGIVLVSHSEKLAAGLEELVMAVGPDALVVAVGGTADGRLGTDADAVERAIKQVDQGDGIVLIPDLGSSVLTIKTILEDVSTDQFALVDCPFVEGAVSAVVTAASGAPLQAVVQAAEEAHGVPKF